MRNLGRRGAILGLVVVLCLAAVVWLYAVSGTHRGGGVLWEGVDATVIEKYAAEAGREARDPLINTDQGDLLLFVFALGGAAGGFVAGYYWRKLISEKR